MLGLTPSSLAIIFTDHIRGDRSNDPFQKG